MNEDVLANATSGGNDFWQGVKFGWFTVFSWLVLPGLALFAVSLLGPVDWPYALVGIAGFLLMVPFLIHLNLLAIWHWKDRYVGNKSKLWGALILLLTFSSWGNLVYLFRHVLPDRKRKGRYQMMGSEPPIGARR